MALRHEEIVHQVMIQWTREGRGRLFKNDSGRAWQGRLTDERMIDGRKAIELFGAHMIKFGLFPGSSDLIGWEIAEYVDVEKRAMVPVKLAVFCAIEVKTAKDTLKPEQKNWLRVVTENGGRGYIARESADGYTLGLWGNQDAHKTI